MYLRLRFGLVFFACGGKSAWSVLRFDLRRLLALNWALGSPPKMATPMSFLSLVFILTRNPQNCEGVQFSAEPIQSLENFKDRATNQEGQGLSVPWSLRPRNRAAAATAAVVAATIAAATEICGDFFLGVWDWHAGSPIGQCDGVQSYPQDTRRKIHSHRTWGPVFYLWLEGAGPMAEISDSVSGDFLAIFLRPRTQSCHALAGDPCLVALGVFLPRPFVAINPFGK